MSQQDEVYFKEIPLGTLVYTRECNDLSPFFTMIKTEHDPNSHSAVAMPKCIHQDGKNETYILVFSNLHSALSKVSSARDGTQINQKATKSILAAIMHHNNISQESIQEWFEKAAKFARENVSKSKQYTLPLYAPASRKNFEQVVLFQHGIVDGNAITLALRDMSAT